MAVERPTHTELVYLASHWATGHQKAMIWDELDEREQEGIRLFLATADIKGWSPYAPGWNTPAVAARPTMSHAERHGYDPAAPAQAAHMNYSVPDTNPYSDLPHNLVDNFIDEAVAELRVTQDESRATQIAEELATVEASMREQADAILLNGVKVDWDADRPERYAQHLELPKDIPPPDAEVQAALDDINPKDAVGQRKCPLWLVPATAKALTAEALKYGAYLAKRADGGTGYGPYNWRDQKISVSIYVSAAQRHVDAYMDREECDVDSGVHHLGHAIAGLMILLDALIVGSAKDDRPAVSGHVGELMRELAGK